MLLSIHSSLLLWWSRINFSIFDDSLWLCRLNDWHKEIEPEILQIFIKNSNRKFHSLKQILETNKQKPKSAAMMIKRNNINNDSSVNKLISKRVCISLCWSTQWLWITFALRRNVLYHEQIILFLSFFLSQVECLYDSSFLYKFGPLS